MIFCYETALRLLNEIFSEADVSAHFPRDAKFEVSCDRWFKNVNESLYIDDSRRKELLEIYGEKCLYLSESIF